ncbi:hypothetical protein CCHR01_15255 [Colletotrichum chrysophilum]|uniref:Uncharacterized protein n=1 Tax=Colletotrichum chrysophilum TaxID=1836956 RepID=A0AAD9A804_9PEZI|nr:hypothetical protein CCHR01_15255 [Colletotrichum chrysophilum]
MPLPTMPSVRSVLLPSSRQLFIPPSAIEWFGRHRDGHWFLTAYNCRCLQLLPHKYEHTHRPSSNWKRPQSISKSSTTHHQQIAKTNSPRCHVHRPSSSKHRSQRTPLPALAFEQTSADFWPAAQSQEIAQSPAYERPLAHSPVVLKRCLAGVEIHPRQRIAESEAILPGRRRRQHCSAMPHEEKAICQLARNASLAASASAPLRRVRPSSFRPYQMSGTSFRDEPRILRVIG